MCLTLWIIHYGVSISWSLSLKEGLFYLAQNKLLGIFSFLSILVWVFCWIQFSLVSSLIIWHSFGMALAHMFPHVNFSIVENFRCFPAISYVNRLGSSNYVTAGRRSQITFLHVYPQGLHDVCSKVSHQCQMVGACLNKHTNCWVSVMTGTRN